MDLRHEAGTKCLYQWVLWAFSTLWCINNLLLSRKVNEKYDNNGINKSDSFHVCLGPFFCLDIVGNDKQHTKGNNRGWNIGGQNLGSQDQQKRESNTPTGRSHEYGLRHNCKQWESFFFSMRKRGYWWRRNSDRRHQGANIYRACWQTPIKAILMQECCTREVRDWQLIDSDEHMSHATKLVNYLVLLPDFDRWLLVNGSHSGILSARILHDLSAS